MVTIKGLRAVPFLQACSQGLRRLPPVKHLFICIADHFEPDWGGAELATQRSRVERWVTAYPRRLGEYTDSRGRPPQHTFFYPAEVYDRHQIDRLCRLVSDGFGDIEVHLHHDNDSSDRLRATLVTHAERLAERHGLLSRDAAGRLRYGFIHGNWALDNSHPDGRWCGVNDEISILLETGCYADFTMPAAPHPAQTRTINRIYYAIDDPGRPKSHDRGIAARKGAVPPNTSLLLVQGPLLVTLRRGLKPRLENGNLSASQPPDAGRIVDWLRAGVCVRGRPDWAFVKLHTHGAPERNAEMLLGDPMSQLHLGLARLPHEIGCRYYYVTAREMAQLVHQAESGLAVPDFDSLCWTENMV